MEINHPKYKSKITHFKDRANDNILSLTLLLYVLLWCHGIGRRVTEAEQCTHRYLLDLMGAPAALADVRPSLGSWSLIRDHLMEVSWLARKPLVL